MLDYFFKNFRLIGRLAQIWRAGLPTSQLHSSQLSSFKGIWGREGDWVQSLYF